MTNRPLTIEDIVRVKALIPDSVNFDYVDEAKLDVYVDNSSPSATTKQKDDIFKITAGKDAGISTVLYFEFIDGELRPKLNRKNG
jgi:hypothetical protein